MASNYGNTSRRPDFEHVIPNLSTRQTEAIQLMFIAGTFYSFMTDPMFRQSRFTDKNSNPLKS